MAYVVFLQTEAGSSPWHWSLSLDQGIGCRTRDGLPLPRAQPPLCVSSPAAIRLGPLDLRSGRTARKIPTFPSEEPWGVQKGSLPEGWWPPQAPWGQLGAWECVPQLWDFWRNAGRQQSPRIGQMSCAPCSRIATPTRQLHVSSGVPAPWLFQPFKQQVRSNRTWCPLHLTPSPRRPPAPMWPREHWSLNS